MPMWPEVKNQKFYGGLFFKPLEGIEHSLKCVKLKIGHHIYFKNFKKVPTLLLGKNKTEDPSVPAAGNKKRTQNSQKV